jgi:hypothetical protein
MQGSLSTVGPYPYDGPSSGQFFILIMCQDKCVHGHYNLDYHFTWHFYGFRLLSACAVLLYEKSPTQALGDVRENAEFKST